MQILPVHLVSLQPECSPPAQYMIIPPSLSKLKLNFIVEALYNFIIKAIAFHYRLLQGMQILLFLV